MDHGQILSAFLDRLDIHSTESRSTRCARERMLFDPIGDWSEIKLEIVKEYARAYSTILSKQSGLRHVYVDGFSGPGQHLSKAKGQMVKGSPLNALEIQPPFREYFLVDLDGDKLDHLRSLVGERKDVHLFRGDCNDVLLNEVFPKVRWEDFRRGLCLLDPYGLHLNWEVIATAGTMRSIDLFLNFPIMDMNRNVLWRSREGMDPDDVKRMTGFWGDDSWNDIAYVQSGQTKMFGMSPDVEKQDNATVAEAFRKRLKTVAGFKNVPQPLAMRNSRGAIVYYLFFASQKDVANKIVKDIFAKHSLEDGT